MAESWVLEAYCLYLDMRFSSIERRSESPLNSFDVICAINSSLKDYLIILFSEGGIFIREVLEEISWF
jgi:hypothetical protein